MGSLSAARLIAILMPTALLGGALGSEYLGQLVPHLGRLYPCEMCYWQRYPHLAAILLALGAIAVRNMASTNLLLTVLGILVVVGGGTWGVYDSGVAFYDSNSVVWPWAAVILLVLSVLLVFWSVSMSSRLTALAALAMATSGAIGVFHAGVEYHWWEGLTRCAVTPGGSGSGNLLADIMAAPVIRCDVAQWTRFGISLAGFNAIFSLGGALAILVLLRRRPA